MVKLSPGLINYTLRHEGVWGSGCMDPHFLDLGTSWRWVVSFTTRPLYPWYPLDRRLGGPQSRSGRCGKNSWPYQDSNFDPSVIQPIASRYTDYAIPVPNTVSQYIVYMKLLLGPGKIFTTSRVGKLNWDFTVNVAKYTWPQCLVPGHKHSWHYK
jgi:hypothetical protein